MPYLSDYAASVAAATRGHDTTVIAAIDDLADAGSVLEKALPGFGISLIRGGPNATIAEVRGRMLQGCRSARADAVVFVDMDDRLVVGAIESHVSALQEMDFSYGDLKPIDAGGASLGGTFFEGAVVPEAIARSDDILLRNFLGFSNTAIRPEALSEVACRPPRESVAVDWWFFSTLLDQGLKGKRAKGVVAEYRQHGANTLGATAQLDRSTVLARCRIVLDHLMRLPKTESRQLAASRLTRVIEFIQSGRIDPNSLANKTRAGVWFDEVKRLVDATEEA